MKRHLATPASIAQLHEFRAGRAVTPQAPMRDGLTKAELKESLGSLSGSDYSIPPELIPRTPPTS
ncbi:MAG TPA: hypothetical protein VJA87_03890 [Candidatus Paceibacterota bacterium]